MNVKVNGPKILFRIPVFGGIAITETIINMWIIMIALTALCAWMTHGLKTRPETKRQIVAEKLVTMVYSLVDSTMGKNCRDFAPYIGTLFAMSITGSLSSLLGLRPYTADLSVTLGWALVTFIMVQITTFKKHGFGGWLHGFVEPVPLLLPLNIVSEIANPISISFRHFGNIAAGTVITSLVYAALAGLSSVVLKFIPNAFLNSIPIFQLGLPALLSIYFDLFTSFLQAYIICMLTMVYIKNAAE